MHLSKASDWYVLVGLPPRHSVYTGEREEVNLKETNFGFVFGSFDKELPLEIGRITPYYVEAYFEDGNRTRIATPLDYEDCTPPDIGFFNPAGKIFCMSDFD